MKFVKGIIIGSAVTAGIIMLYSDEIINKRSIIKKGRCLAKKMGIY